MNAPDPAADQPKYDDRPPEVWDKTRKEHAEEIVHAVEQQPVAEETKTTAAQNLLAMLSGVIHNVDQQAAAQRVQQLRAEHPDANDDELAEMLIGQKCQQTGLVGVATSGAGLIPGIGTITSLTVGATADLAATFRLQAELVIEIAEVYGHKLDDAEKQGTILFVTGLGAGSAQLAAKAGQEITTRVTARYAQEWLTHALPIVGVFASAGANVLGTYIIGQRARAYFGRDEQDLGDWQENLRAIVGIDERKIATWLQASGQNSWYTVSKFVGQAAGTTKDGVVKVTTGAADMLAAAGSGMVAAGSAVGTHAGAAAGAVRDGAQDVITRVGGLFSRDADADADDAATASEVEAEQDTPDTPTDTEPADDNQDSETS